MKKIISCNWCGVDIERYPSQINNKNFCSREHLANYSNKKLNPKNYDKLKDYSGQSKNLSKINQELNPSRMNKNTREKIRKARLDSGEGKSYRKYYGKHEHRVVAEKMLGRNLLPGEVVHHKNRNIRDNRPENLHVFKNQNEHARWHKENDGR